MAYSDNSSLRIAVANIRKGPVRRHERGIVEEDDLGRSFCHAGCKVAGVRIAVDAKRRDMSRGFGFVDFDDCESLDIALKLHNTDAKGLAGKDGKLRIERAHATTDEGRKIQQELLDARNQTKEMEQELAFHEDRLSKLLRKVKREQQNRAQAHELKLQEEKRRQAMFRQALETIKDANQRIHTAIEVAEEHATATGAIMISVDGEPSQQHQEEGSACADFCATSAFFPEDGPGPTAVSSGPWQNNGGATQHGAIAALTPTPFEPPAHEESAHRANRTSHDHAVDSTTDNQGGDAIGDDFLSRAEQAEIRIRNTFIEFWVPPLVRTRSAPPMTLPGFPTRGTATMLDEALPLNSNKQSASTTEPPLLAKANDEPALWELSDRRDYFLAADVSRALLEEKMDGPSSMDGSTVTTAELRCGPHTDTSSKVSSGTLGTTQSLSSTSRRGATLRRSTFTSKAQENAAPTSGTDCPSWNRTVILRGFPKKWPAHQVKDEVLSLLQRLWQRDGLMFDSQLQLHHGDDGGIEVRSGRRIGEETRGTCLVRLRTHMVARWLVDNAGVDLTVGGHRLSAAWARPRPLRR